MEVEQERKSSCEVQGGKNSETASGGHSLSETSELDRNSSQRRRRDKSSPRQCSGRHSRSRSKSHSRRSQSRRCRSREGTSDKRMRSPSKSGSSRRDGARDSRSRTNSVSPRGSSPSDNRYRHQRKRNDDTDWRKSSKYMRTFSGESKYAEMRDETPNNTIMIRGLPRDFTTEEIQPYFVKTGVRIKDFRIPRFHDTNESRGFAFIEFETIADAKKWKDSHGDTFLIRDSIHASLCYSKSTSALTGQSRDWICKVCHILNFSYREECYKCGQAKVGYETCNGSSDCGTIDVSPTSVVALSNLDTLTTENRVLELLQEIPEAAYLSLKKVTIEKDAFNISIGVCLIEMHSIHESNALLKILTSRDLTIDGREVLITFWKKPKKLQVISLSPLGSNTSAAKSAPGASALEAANWTNSSATNAAYTIDDVEMFAKQYASAYCTSGNVDEYNCYLIYYRQYFSKELLIQQEVEYSAENCATHPPTTSHVQSCKQLESSFDNLQKPGIIGPQLQSKSDNTAAEISIESHILKPALRKSKIAGISVKQQKKKGQQKGNISTGPTLAESTTNCHPPHVSSMSTPMKPFWMPVTTGINHAMNRSVDMHSELRSGSKSVVELREENPHFPTSTIATDSVVNNIVVNTEDGNVCCYLCKRKFSCQQLYERHVAESELHRRNLETLIEL